MNLITKLFKKVFRDKLWVKPKYIEPVRQLMIENFLYDNLHNNPKYKDPKKLNKFEQTYFSQCGEDGIILEIFNRIGTTNKVFVEIGVGNGLENNTFHLLINDWTGYWFEAKKKSLNYIQNKLHMFLTSNKLRLKEAFVSKDNIQKLFADAGVPKEFDLFSLDIDSNDYWVLEAIKDYSPRVLVLEYNAGMGPYTNWIMKHDSKYENDGTVYFGASLKAFEKLCNQKGYKLVGCNLIGSNAFFVREDLVGDKFLEPYTSENHFEPPRYFLLRKIGYPKNWGDFEQNLS